MPETATATMRAAILARPGTIEMTSDAALPEPAAGQLRIRLEGSGVCASNLSPWQGQPWFEYPFPAGAPGHEGWGVVDGIGDAVDDFEIGDRVAFLSSHAYAEFDLADSAQVAKLPAALDGQPFPGEPLGCAMNIFRRSRIEPGQTVAIVGVGFLGALLTRLATQAGARVIGISRRTYSLEVARSMGAAETIAMDDHARIIEQVSDLTGGNLCDRVIEAVGQQWPLDLAAEITRERGTLVIAGYHQDGARQVDMQLWNWRGLDVINAHERDPRIYLRGMREAIEAVATGRLEPSSLYTPYPLDRLDDALNATRDRPDGFIKALVMA
ncbi:MAG TPA: zinc-binding dehydrogenase [Longimicrobiaceae bacterium]|nr:zinc-binding dehydrogenase [Longimicrobiaceae bacterium]